MGDSDRATAIRACSFATHYVPSFFRMPARFGALVSAFLFVFMALWSSVGAECCGNSLQKLGIGGDTDCPCPTEPPCNRQPTVRIKDLHRCNLFGCNCDECDATKLCPQIPACATAGGQRVSAAMLIQTNCLFPLGLDEVLDECCGDS